MLTRSGWAVLVGAAAGAVAGRMFGVTELFVLAAVAGVLLLVALVLVRRPVPSLSITRRVRPARLVAGGLGRVEVAITNRGPGRLAPVTLVDPVEGTIGARMAVGPIPPGTSQEVGYRLPALRRGLLSIGPLTVEVTDPFGLARRRIAGAAAVAVTVVPAAAPAPPLPMGDGRHEPLAGRSRRTVATSGVEDLVTLRPYVVGDDLRRVHWPSTAHADELQVRRDEERWQGHITVLLETRADAMEPEAFERAVSVAAGIIDAVSRAGDRIRLATTTGADSGMVDARRTEHQLVDELVLVQQVDEPSRPELPHPDGLRRTAVVALCGAGDDVAEALRLSGSAEVEVLRFEGRDRP